MIRKLLVPCLVGSALLISCGSNAAPTALPTAEPAPIDTTAPQETASMAAGEVMQALQQRDMEALSTLIHPTSGVRFSPYAFVQDSDLVFMAEQIVVLLTDPTVYTWGVQDGTGFPIEMTFEEYFGRFVYDQDYVNAEQIGTNERIGIGNTIDNSLEYYSGATVVEYHFSGFDSELAGMDWRSLRLVLRQEGSEWYLIGIIHDEWTI
jgi:hypothetical protein